MPSLSSSSSLQMRRSASGSDNKSPNTSNQSAPKSNSHRVRRRKVGKHNGNKSGRSIQAIGICVLAAWFTMTCYILSSTSSLPTTKKDTDKKIQFIRGAGAGERDGPDSNPALRLMENSRRFSMERQRDRVHSILRAVDRNMGNQDTHKKRARPGMRNNDIHALWDRTRLFQQRLGGFSGPEKVTVPSDLQHARGQVKFEGFNTSAKMLDMRVLNYELPFDNPDGGSWKQGWDVQPKKQRPLTVYVIPHSHCDPGWIKTFDQYFRDQTKSIISTVIEALQKDKRRKFIWAEISYFEWWWREQSTETQEIARSLLKNGQLEFVTGGWVQPDEANTQLYAMEIQLQEGHDWIKKTFGEEYIPKYGWAIDPFGYSPTMAYLLKKYGFKAMLIQRVHYAIKKELASRQHLEFNWRQTWDETGEHDVFSHVMPFFSYDVPHTCGPDPAVCCQFDFARSPVGRVASCPWGKNPKQITRSNVKERAMLLLDQYEKKAALYRSNVVLVPLGDDFRYMEPREAENQYQNYQAIFDYINDNVDGVSIQFGTLSEYFEKAMGSFDAPLLKGSFFTYADVNEDYWSGYFTSRVFDKALDRKLERVLFAATAMGATKEEMQSPRRALSLFQHHDGVTGTAKNHVVEDYAQRIHGAINTVQDYIMNQIVKEHKVDKTSAQACWKSDAPRGLSQNLCGNEGKVYLYNPLETPQSCGEIEVQGHSTAVASLPCEVPGPLPTSTASITFDARTGLMIHPVKEQWMVWNVQEGGAYLFHPGTLSSFNVAEDVDIESGGYVVTTPNWKRTVVERKVPGKSGRPSSTVIDFVYETNIETSNEEWFVRFSADIDNGGVFHTDLNGFNFDTHHFRDDMPIQSQVFPMPTLAAIEDDVQRMTVLSEHAQGTASLQEGSIDVWLDRRLAQDDNRGLGQGVKDNVPTRTRLRVVLETDGYETNGGDFQPSPVCKRMWDELNHPLEMFGTHTYKSATEAQEAAVAQEGQFDMLPGATFDTNSVETVKEEKNVANNGPHMLVPFVYMVYKRVDYLQRSIESLRNSDFDKSRTPLIISIDGHVPEMMEYVESLRSEFQLTILVHPYSCHDHPDTFPGDDESLNRNYRGDAYGNKRSGWATCAKHHFAWMIKQVYSLDLNADAFLFLEEDYIVAPTIYKTVLRGFYLLGKLSGKNQDLFGICLDPTEGFSRNLIYRDKEGWLTDTFKSGPMALTRTTWERFQRNAKEFCTFDDYNWDWSMVHMMGLGMLPAKVILPSVPQALHVGAEDAMHGGDVRGIVKLQMANAKEAQPFHGTKLFNVAPYLSKPKRHDNGYGGWGHPADQEHCMQVIRGKK